MNMIWNMERMLWKFTGCHTARSKVVIVDDLLATGGTALAVTRLVEKLGGIVAGILFGGIELSQRKKNPGRIRGTFPDSIRQIRCSDKAAADLIHSKHMYRIRCNKPAI